MTVALDFKPTTEAELKQALGSPQWRLNNLYKIMIKGKEGEDELVITFKPNRAQRRLFNGLHYRNIILKARQLGFTTAIAIYFLDCCLFRANVRAGIVAQDLGAVETIFRDKVKFAYDNLPPQLRELMPLKNETKRELVFGHNNSAIRVGTSMRSGTLQYLHVSEFGKICAKAPDKAREVITGSIPAVPLDGVIFIESTAEGREGEFFNMTQRAMKQKQVGKRLTRKDYAFHFFPWWGAMEYRMDPDDVPVTDKENAYFDKIEASQGCVIDIEQRAWWVATRDSEFSGEDSMMWQEYPSTPEEAFQQSTEGCYYTTQLVSARKQGRIGAVPWVPAVPVNTFWDIGHNDLMTIWFHQHIGNQHRFIRYYEESGESFDHFVREMQKTGYIWGRHYLPHDGDHKRLGTASNQSPKEMLEALGLRNVEIVPRCDSVITAINLTRDKFADAWIDEQGCKEGLAHLELYRKEWNDRLGTWKDTPRHDIHSNGADGFRQWAQGYQTYTVTAGSRPKRKNRSGRVA